MTTNETKYFTEGRDLYHHALKYYGTGLRVTQDTIRKMSKELDLNQSYIRKCIDTFLYN